MEEKTSCFHSNEINCISSEVVLFRLIAKDETCYRLKVMNDDKLNGRHYL